MGKATKGFPTCSQPHVRTKTMKDTITNGEIHFGGYGGPGFWLDHSCDEWIIGDIDYAKKFAADLLKTIEEVEKLNLNKLAAKEL